MTIETLESRQMFADVTGLVLVNADTGKDIGPLKHGATINLATLPTKNLSVRATTTDDTESVKFRLDGGASHIENIAPYALRGNSGSDYVGWKPAVGSHDLAVKAYTRDKARGAAGARVVVKFKVIDRPIATPSDTPTPVPIPMPRPVPAPAPKPEPIPEPEPQPQPQPGISAPNIPGNWKLDYADEFSDGNFNGWDPYIWWNTDGSAGGNIGDERTSPGAVTVTDGNLNLTATKSGNTYTSGIVTTDGQYDFTYGYAEARIDMPAGKGMWPAFWMLPASHDDGKGEIDVMEVVGDEPWMFHMNYHVDGPGDDAESTDVGFDLSDGFHTFGVDWQKDKITWYLDGKAMHSAPNHTHEPLYLILNLAVGGDWPGSPNSATQFPSTMKVDYVRVWEKTAA